VTVNPRRFVDLKAHARTAPIAVARLLPLLLRASTATTSALDDDDDEEDEAGRGERAFSVGRAVVVMSGEGRAVATAALVKVMLVCSSFLGVSQVEH